MIPQLKQLAKDQHDYIVAVRRHLHENPEISNQEENTVQYVINELRSMGITPIDVPRGGVIAFLGDETKNNGKTILLRADIDALPIIENPENLNQPRKVISKNHGAAHMCGHDGHTAMLLGAAKILKAHEDQINGRILLMFERGEEGTDNVVYIHRYFQDHNIHVDSSFGMHAISYLPSGQYFVAPGPIMAGLLKFEITLHGAGGHGSRPDMTKNPIDCFTAIHAALNTVRMRTTNPFVPITYSICAVETSSQSMNVIPNSLTFSGNVRIFDHAQGVIIKERFKDVIDKTCELFECTPEYKQWDGPIYPVINQKDCAELAEQVVGEYIGHENVVRDEPIMASETFAYTNMLFPGAYGQLGIYNEEKGTGSNHHTDRFDLDEDVLHIGVYTHVAYALAFLNSDIDVSAERYQGTLKELYVNASLREDRMDAFD